MMQNIIEYIPVIVAIGVVVFKLYDIYTDRKNQNNYGHDCNDGKSIAPAKSTALAKSTAPAAPAKSTAPAPAPAAPAPAPATVTPVSTVNSSSNSYNTLTKFLGVGINYDNYDNYKLQDPVNGSSIDGGKIKLTGCINDVTNIKNFFTRRFGLDPKTFKILTDDKNTVPEYKPTKANILEGFNWLVTDLNPGQNVCFYYSGHGTLKEDENNDESTNTDSGFKDSCLCPVNDFTIEFLYDDEIRTQLVKNIPTGCKCFIILDACNSGSGADLKYTFDDKWERISDKNHGDTDGDVFLVAGCRDNQTSSNVTITETKTNTVTGVITKTERSYGKLTYELLETWRKNTNISLKDLVSDMKNNMCKNKYTQIPTLSVSNTNIDVTKPLNLHDKITSTVQSAQPAQPAQPTQPTQPAQSAQSAQSAQPTQPNH